ncbi:MAG: alanine dehydrogenase [Chlorobiaceae bacterium]|nr:alanine dehydrogenase [Chlorobiaceae bacterium]MBA4308895.1 alanine dehydrogenase [Chlorobiaceae bacterium]
MRIGIPKELKFEESRISLAPAGVDSLVRAGHTVYIQKGAGEKSHFSDEEYSELGAKIVYTTEEVYQRSEMIVKVARLTDEESHLLQENQILFSFLHFAVGEKKILNSLLAKKVTAIGYELIENEHGLPVLHSMSEIAGQLAIQAAEDCLLAKSHLSRGILLGGFSGVAPSAVVIIGAGVLGTTAARAALNRGAQVVVLDRDLNRLRRIDETFPRKVTTVAANPYTIARGVKFADVLIGAVLIKGEKAPHIVTEEMVKTMKRGAVIIDCSIDQGGCIATSRPTSISTPTYVMHDVIHYAVPNMPAFVPRSASYGLTNAALTYIHSIADKGLASALMEDSGLSKGVCTFNGFCSNEVIAETFDVEFKRIHFFSKN